MNSSQAEKPELVKLEQVMPEILSELENGRSVRLYPRGTSMLPMLRQGIDSVLLSPLPDKLKKYDIPFYQRSNGQYVLHRIVAAGDTYTCIGDNQFRFESGLHHEQMIAVVTAFYRGERMIRTDHIGYRLYCWYWYYSRRARGYWRRGKSWLRRHFI